MLVRLSRRQFTLGSLSLASAIVTRPALAQMGRKYAPVVPGTGIRIARTGDDFEAEDWSYNPAHPKSSYNIDENIREPGSLSKNSLWVEGAKRGTPDVARRVPTPPGGIEGSKGSMLIQTLRSGIPNRLSYQQQQDDLLHNVQGTVGRTLPVGWSPNCVCRVYVPPTVQWEHRDGASFGYRIGLLGWGKESSNEEYWPGFFVHMERTLKNNERVYSVKAWVRANQGGQDVPSLSFEPESWMTMGMSVTPDGQCHFFLRKGIEDLTKDDCVGSYWCYNYRAHSFQTFFYNVINMDDGRNVSTPWIIDDAFLYAATPPADKVRLSNGQKATQQPATR